MINSIERVLGGTKLYRYPITFTPLETQDFMTPGYGWAFCYNNGTFNHFYADSNNMSITAPIYPYYLICDKPDLTSDVFSGGTYNQEQLSNIKIAELYCISDEDYFEFHYDDLGITGLTFQEGLRFRVRPKLNLDGRGHTANIWLDLPNGEVYNTYDLDETGLQFKLLFERNDPVIAYFNITLGSPEEI